MLNVRVSGFDWDEGNRAKCQKHGVSIAQIESLFANGPRIAPDPKHSAEEDRLIALGRASGGASSIRRLHDTHEKQKPVHPPGDGKIHACQGGCSL